MNRKLAPERAPGFHRESKGPSTRSLRSLARGILHGWPAMSEPDGSPKADRQVSRMVEAAGVALTRRIDGKGLMLLAFLSNRQIHSKGPVNTRIAHTHFGPRSKVPEAKFRSR